MKRHIIFLSFMILLGIFYSSAEMHYFDFELGQFDKVKVLDNVNVVYKCVPDSTGFAQFSTENDDYSHAFIFTYKSTGTLKIQVNSPFVDSKDLPTLYIYSDFLTSAENTGITTFTIENPAPCAELKLTQVGNGTINATGINATKVVATLNTGNGTINMEGSCDNAIFKMVGTGLISADRLKCNSVGCRILGTGSIGCWPLSELNVKGLGSTKIYYKGNPVIKKTGGGKLLQLPSSYVPTAVEDEPGDKNDYKSTEDSSLNTDDVPAIEEDSEENGSSELDGDQDAEESMTVVTADD